MFEVISEALAGSEEMRTVGFGVTNHPTRTWRIPCYCSVWAANADWPRFERAEIPVRVQTEANLLVEGAWNASAPLLSRLEVCQLVRREVSGTASCFA